jgi:hypothetical protein
MLKSLSRLSDENTILENKDVQSTEIDDQTEEFLNSGGTIKKIPYGTLAQPVEKPKPKYNRVI